MKVDGYFKRLLVRPILSPIDDLAVPEDRNHGANHSADECSAESSDERVATSRTFASARTGNRTRASS